MKRILMLIATVLVATSVANAQDLTSVKEAYNEGAQKLDMGDKQAALDQFIIVLADAETLGEDAIEVTEQCKIMIPQLMISIAKDNIKDNLYDDAITLLEKAAETAGAYGNIEKAAEADALANQVFMQKANNFLNAKDFANAITVYEQIMAKDSTNAMAALRLGQCYASTGNTDKAEEALNIAAANGQEKQANKLLSNIYIKKAQACYKAKNHQEAFDLALKSNEYLENANAYKIAGQAAFGLGKDAEALPYLEKYVELSPNAKDAKQMMHNIGRIAFKLGDKAKAKVYFEKLVSDPQFGPGAQQMLKQIN